MNVHYFCYFLLNYISSLLDYSKLMVIGGYDGEDYLDVVEVVDLDDPNKTCQLVESYPEVTELLTVGLVDGVVKACGGMSSERDCYDYDPSSNTWNSSPGLLFQKRYASSSLIDGIWLVSGDTHVPDGNMTEFWTGAEFVLGPTLPEMMYSPCQVTINATHVFFVDCLDQTAYLLDWNMQEWTQMDDMTTYKSDFCGCGLIRNDQFGKEVVVAGYGTSEIFNFDELAWRDGPELPHGFGYESVQLMDTFLLVGGLEDDSETNKIYIFDEDNYKFTLKSQTLWLSRRYAGAVVVPDELVNCS